MWRARAAALFPCPFDRPPTSAAAARRTATAGCNAPERTLHSRQHPDSVAHANMQPSHSPDCGMCADISTHLRHPRVTALDPPAYDEYKYERLPELPCDIRRMIWQRAWRSSAASTLQRAWRLRMLRRTWRVMLSRWRVLRYVRLYMQKGGYAVVEMQGRGNQHVHVMWPGALDMNMCTECE